MSNCVFPLGVVVVKDPLLDFVEPVYTLKEPSSLKSFVSQDISTYSNNQINAQLNLNSTNFVIDTNIIYEQPVDVVINGTTSTGSKILVDGCWAMRSNVLGKLMQSLELKYSSTSYSYSPSDVISLMERYGNNSADKYSNNYDLSYLDQSQSYSDLVGSTRNPLGNYGNCNDNVLQRGSHPVVIGTNTTTQATFSTTLRTLLMSPPLRDKLLRGGAAQGLSHLSTIGINISFVGNMGNRLLSFADVRPGGDVLTITNIQVQVNMPRFSFTQIKSRSEEIPRHLTFAMSSQERYPYNVVLPYGVPTNLNISSFTLTRVPHSILFGARPSNNAYFSNIGAFIPDTFASVSNLVIQYDGQNLMSSSTPAQIYKMCHENGLSDNYLQWSGESTLRSVGAGATPPSYINGPGSAVKLQFVKDVSVYPKSTIGAENNTSISMSLTLTNTNKLTNDFTFYLCLLYDDVIQFYDNNLAQISMVPVSKSDLENAKGSERVHYDVIRSSDITGSGIMSGISNLLKSGSFLPMIKTLKSALSSPELRSNFKKFLREQGHENAAASLEALGFGRKKKHSMKHSRKGGARSGGSYEGGDYEGGDYEGGDYEGGKYASRQHMKHSLLE